MITTPFFKIILVLKYFINKDLVWGAVSLLMSLLGYESPVGDWESDCSHSDWAVTVTISCEWAYRSRTQPES